MDGHFSYAQCILKKGQKSDPFAAHYDQRFNLLCHILTYVSVWDSNELCMSISVDQLFNPQQGRPE